MFLTTTLCEDLNASLLFRRENDKDLVEVSKKKKSKLISEQTIGAEH